MKNKKIGFAAEARYLYQNWLGRYSGSRFYGSMGIFDMIFVDKNYNTRFVQLKYSKKGSPRISQKEIIDIQIWIDQHRVGGIPHVWVGYVLWAAGEKPREYKLN